MQAEELAMSLLIDNHYVRRHPETRQGENNGRVKLTAGQVSYIRSSNLPGIDLALKFKVSTSAVSAARTGRSWKSTLI
jgi:hypothetical protein